MNFIITTVILCLTIDIVLGISIIILTLLIKNRFSNIYAAIDDLDSRISSLINQVKDLQRQLNNDTRNS